MVNVLLQPFRVQKPIFDVLITLPENDINKAATAVNIIEPKTTKSSQLQSNPIEQRDLIL
ncbi:hypothetical protein BB987_11115 [Photorhabdus temperata]|uniref:hypothetical protein n=1 Tax=Photorhabdus khanii TaxID=1004150 RepID=UPI0004B62EC3|nr:hypothetical protein [Photorhabdus khanii]OHV53922.1 hypothetical protein BB987_11115 [Photorhabdus temperata]